MAHLHHRHAAAAPIQHVGSGLLKHALGQGGRARTEIDHTQHEKITLEKGLNDENQRISMSCAR
jgi:hypothetical protein